MMYDYDDLAYGPSGGRKKQWLAGVAFASWPFLYGLICLQRGKITLFGSRGNMELTGPEALWWAQVFIAVGLFIHFHYFWGLSDRLRPFSQKLTVLAMLWIVISMGMTFYYVIYQRF